MFSMLVTGNLNGLFSGTSVNNITKALDDAEGCYRQAPLHKPQLFRTNLRDCLGAINMIAAHDRPNPTLFRRYDNSTFILPITFTFRTCLIYLDMISADAQDVFYVAQIMAVAINTARRCTALRTTFGGRALAGPRRLMEVLVIGTP